MGLACLGVLGVRERRQQRGERGGRKARKKGWILTGEHLFVPSQDLRVRHRRSTARFVDDDAVGAHHPVGWDSGDGRRGFRKSWCW